MPQLRATRSEHVVATHLDGDNRAHNPTSPLRRRKYVLHARIEPPRQIIDPPAAATARIAHTSRRACHRDRDTGSSRICAYSSFGLRARSELAAIVA